MIKATIYHHVWDPGMGEIEQSIIVHTKEFGWLEFFDDNDEPLMFKSKRELIAQTYNKNYIQEDVGVMQKLGEL